MALTDQTSAAVTREKLIEAAGGVFAEIGFEAATVREICARAGTNVAAVNYHFGDKLGLYTEVLKSSVIAQQDATLSGTFAHPSEPRASLRALIYAWLERAREAGKSSWMARIMAHELAHPTPALDRVAEAMSTNYLRLRVLVSNIIGSDPDDPRTRRCVHSVVGQVLHYLQSPPMLERLWPDLDLNDAEQRRALADHIVEFSLAGMEQIAHRKRERRPRGQRPQIDKAPGRRS